MFEIQCNFCNCIWETGRISVTRRKEKQMDCKKRNKSNLKDHRRNKRQWKNKTGARKEQSFVQWCESFLFFHRITWSFVIHRSWCETWRGPWLPKHHQHRHYQTLMLLCVCSLRWILKCTALEEILTVANPCFWKGFVMRLWLHIWMPQKFILLLFALCPLSFHSNCLGSIWSSTAWVSVDVWWWSEGSFGSHWLLRFRQSAAEQLWQHV